MTAPEEHEAYNAALRAVDEWVKGLHMPMIKKILDPEVEIDFQVFTKEEVEAWDKHTCACGEEYYEGCSMCVSAYPSCCHCAWFFIVPKDSADRKVDENDVRDS